MSRPGVLVTRPADQARDLAAALDEAGYTPILAPCLERRLIDGPPLDLAGVAAIAVTSANGVAALARRTAERGLRLIAVGEATAETARRAGFRTVETAGGDGAALAAHIAAQVKPTHGRIIHLSAEDAAIDLAAVLGARGFQTNRVVGYGMAPVAALPDLARAALCNRAVAAALLMSARTAQAFGQLVADAGLAGSLSTVAGLCLSDAVAAAARPWGFSNIAVAAEPRVEALLACLRAVVPPG